MRLRQLDERVLEVGLDRSEQAITVLEQRLTRAPRDANAHFLLGNTHAALSHRANARAHYEKMLDLDPAHPRATGTRRLLQSF